MLKVNNGIRDISLRRYLNQTKAHHNGKDYFDFIDYKTKGVNRANMAYIFGVVPHTMGTWWTIYQEENP